MFLQNADPKTGWKILVNFLPNKRSISNNICLLIEGIKISDPFVVCTKFADYFRDKISNFVNNTYSASHISNILLTDYANNIRTNVPACSSFSLNLIDNALLLKLINFFKDSKSNPHSLTFKFFFTCNWIIFRQ